jgi:hypothetical protein
MNSQPTLLQHVIEIGRTQRSGIEIAAQGAIEPAHKFIGSTGFTKLIANHQLFEDVCFKVFQFVFGGIQGLMPVQGLISIRRSSASGYGEFLLHEERYFLSRSSEVEGEPYDQATTKP